MRWAALALGACLPFLQPASVARAAGDEPEYVVIKAARVITVSGEEHRPGVVVIEDGKISAVGKGLEYPPSAKVINAGGGTVTPGLVHARSRSGLERYGRKGVNGDQSAADEVQLSWMEFDALLAAGFTAVVFYPDGEDIPGLAVAVRTAGPEDERWFEGSGYLRAAPPWDAKGKENLRNALKKAKEEIEKVEKARKDWEEKQKKEKGAETTEPKPPKGEDSGKPGRFSDEGGDDSPTEDEAAKQQESQASTEFKPPKIDPKHQPLVDLLQEKEGKRIVVELARASDWLHLQDVLKPYDQLSPVVLLESDRFWADFNYIAESLGKAKAKVVSVAYLNQLPQTTTRYNLAVELIAGGCEVSLIPRSDSQRDLEQFGVHLAELIRAGLPADESLRAVTLHPARVAGIDEKVGSIEKGKDADLVIWDDEPSDPFAQPEKVLIRGEIVWERGEP